MPYKLIVVESPEKAKVISSFLEAVRSKTRIPLKRTETAQISTKTVKAIPRASYV